MTNMERVWRWAGPLSFCALIGVLFGRLDFAMTQRGPVLLAVSNVGALWLALAFFVGLLARSVSHAALCGVVVLLAAMFGFYDAFHLAGHTGLTTTLHIASPWLIAAPLCGFCYGVMGYLWCSRRSVLAAVTLVSPFLLEPVAWHLGIHPGAPVHSVSLLESTLGLLVAFTLLAVGLLPVVVNRATNR